MDPFDQEPVAPAADQPLTPARLAATAAAALPAVGFGLLCLFQGFAELGSPSLDCAFHLMLGASLLVLFADVAVFIQRSDDLGKILLAGVLGFAGAFGAVMLAELGGPPVLGVLFVVAGAWALTIAVRGARANRR